MKKENLVKTAQELNKVIAPDPAINVKGEEAQLKAQIIECAELIDYDMDKFSPIAIQVMVELECWNGEIPAEAEKEVKKAPTKTKAKVVEVDEVEEEDVTEEPQTGVKKQVGVIASICALIEASGKTGLTKKEILSALIKKFPERSADSMGKTINVQVPNRISKEKWTCNKTENGKYYKA